MSTPKVSVIVPVFNGEDVLGDCLDSLLAQTIADLEIIVVNDGSTDGTEAVCARYAASDSRIRVVRQSNRGVSSARNAGVDLAEGQYLAFADADDVVPRPGIERLLRRAEAEEADLVIGGYLVEQDGATRAVQPVGGVSTFDLLCSFLAGRSHSAFWNKLIRRTTLGQGRFPEGIRYAEDQVLLVHILISTPLRFAIVKEPVYLHRLSAASETGAGGRSLFDFLEAKLLIGRMLLEHGSQKKLRACFMEGAEKAIVSVARNIDGSLSSEASDHLLKYVSYLRALGFPIRSRTRAGMIVFLANLPRWAWRYSLEAMRVAAVGRMKRQR